MRAAETIPFDGRTQFHDAVLRALQTCRHAVLILDPSLADWPFESAEGATALRSAVARGARLRILLRESDWIERHGDRLRRLSREFPSRVEIRKLPENLHLVECLLVGDRQHTVRRAHADSMRGTAVLASPGEAEAPADRFETAWQESVPCLPATTLGL